MEETDIKRKGDYPANVLSNFYANAFVLDGVRCASMEGFLQSLKYRNSEKQVKVCALTDTAAKKAGAKKKLWKLTGGLYWRGKRYKRESEEFDGLLMKAYTALAENPEFIKALEAAKGTVLKHTIGKHGKRKTVLTEEEFIGYLNRIRQIKGLL